MVSVWAAKNRLVFGQVKTEEKSNKITAIPTLLEKLALEGCIVTIDAMGRQYKTAGQVVGKRADYLFSLKKNQETLYEDVQEYFRDRDYAVSGDVGWLQERHPDWKTIRSIGVVESKRGEKGEVTVERRHFISSLPADAQQFAKAVRSHWGIENSLHYVLDVAVGEDGSRLRKDKGPENMAILRKVALTATRGDTETKSSIIGRRKQAAWSNEYLEQLLFQSSPASGSV
jgi:predicted transposase YbfD/YdcC